MTKNKKTKGALLVSALSLLLCVAMLAGSTFAWFTDSSAASVNKITAGNLDVALYSKTDAGYTEVTEETKLFQEGALWEPGHVEVVNLKVANLGTLALQYTLGVNVSNEVSGTNVAGEVFNLSDYLQFALIDGEKNYGTGARDQAIADAEAANPVSISNLAANKPVVLYPKGEEATENHDYRCITMIVYMPTTVDNVANYRGEQIPSIDLGVALTAYQTPYEEDSFGNDYDIEADPGYDPFAEADAEALANGNNYRDSEGNYHKITSDQSSFLLDAAYNGGEYTLISDIGAASSSSSSKQADYSNKQSVLDLNGKTYTFGELELKQSTSSVAENSSLVIKDGTMMGSINFSDILKSNNAMQTVTLDHVTMGWGNPLAWNARDPNYYGLNLSTKTAGSVFTVMDSVLNCNAKFYTTAYNSDLETRAAANLTNTVVNGQLCGQGLTMNVNGCTVNGEVRCNASNSSKTTINISNSTVNGNAFFDAAKSAQKNDVTINNTVINGNLLTDYSRNNVHITLTDVTVTGTLRYPNLSAKVPADKVTIVSGTYGFDPTNYLASGSTVAQTGAVWVVTAG